MTNDALQEIADAINNLQVAMMKARLEPMQKIIVDRQTGFQLKSMCPGPYLTVEHNPDDKSYCGHICGVPFHMEYKTSLHRGSMIP